VRLIVGPFRSGKSVAAVIEMWQNARLSRNTRYLIIRKTYRMLMDSCVNTFFEWVPKGFGTWSESNMTFSCTSPGGGIAEFLFRSADSSDDIEKFRGVEISGAWLDEAQELSPDVKRIVRGRMSWPLTHPFYTLVLTTNPCDRAHWIYHDFVAHPLKGHRYWKQGVNENPHLPKEYYKQLADEFRDRPELKKRYVEGDWGAVFDGAPVYKEQFYYNTHVAGSPLEPVDGTMIVRGWDFGLSPACIFTQVHPNGQWMILGELCDDNCSVDDFSDAVKAVCARQFKGYTFEDVGDPAGKSRMPTDESTCYDVLASKGIFCREAPTNDILPRLEAVKRRLEKTKKGLPMMIIDPRCDRLIDGFSGGYKFKERGATQTYSEVPEKNKYSHIHDALQYAALDLFGYTDYNKELFTRKLDYRNLGVIGA
jgi:hypothetical protein